MTTKVYIDGIEDDSIWITGHAEHFNVIYDWYAKVKDEKDKSGIEKGRTVKLVVRKRDGSYEKELKEDDFWNGVVANFDRGWVIKPTGSAATEVFYSIFDELESIKTYKERIYNGSKIKKVIEKTKSVFPIN